MQHICAYSCIFMSFRIYLRPRYQFPESCSKSSWTDRQKWRTEWTCGQRWRSCDPSRSIPSARGGSTDLFQRQDEVRNERFWYLRRLAVRNAQCLFNRMTNYWSYFCIAAKDVIRQRKMQRECGFNWIQGNTVLIFVLESSMLRKDGQLNFSP